MTYCITSRRGTSKLLELVPNPFDDINKICSKQTNILINSAYNMVSVHIAKKYFYKAKSCRGLYIPNYAHKCTCRSVVKC